MLILNGLKGVGITIPKSQFETNFQRTTSALIERNLGITVEIAKKVQSATSAVAGDI